MRIRLMFHQKGRLRRICRLLNPIFASLLAALPRLLFFVDASAVLCRSGTTSARSSVKQPLLAKEATLLVLSEHESARR